MVLPTFLLLGAARAGTTALHRWFADHPDACMSRPKETQFFTLDFDRGPEFYASHFAHHRGERVVGESTPVYLALPYVAPRIARLLPDARLVAVLREPVRQVVSSWAKLRSAGAERRPFDEAIRTELARPPGEETVEAMWRDVVAATRGGPPVHRAPYLLAGRYADAVRRFQSLFSPDQLTVVLHDDLSRDPVGTTRVLAAAVGLDHSRAPAPCPVQVNETTGAREGWVRRRVAPVPSARVRRALGRAARRLDSPSPPTADPGLLRELHAYFDDANAQLPALLGRSLREWRQPPMAVAAHG